MHKTLNEVRLIGFVHGKARFNYMANGSKVCNFVLKTFTYRQSASGAVETAPEFHRCLVWGDRCPAMESMIQDKHMLFVAGSLRSSKYEDKASIKREITEIVAVDVKLLCKPIV